MATFKSDQLTTPQTPGSLVHANAAGGRLRVAYFSYTTTGTEVANDVIELCKLPAKARIVGGSIHLDQMDKTGDGATTPTTIDIGWAGAANAIADNLGPDTGAVDTDIAGPGTAAYGAEMSAETTVIATVVDSDIPASAAIKGHLVYVLD